MGEGTTSKRSPKRRGPAKRYAPVTTDVTPAKKPRKKAVPKKGAKTTTTAQTIMMPTATVSTVIAIPETLTPSISPLDERDEISRITASFQNYVSRILEELEKAKVDKERLMEQITSLLLDRRVFLNKIRELESQVEDGFVDRVMVMAQEYKFKRRNSTIIQEAIVAAEVLESETETQSAYPVGQPEQVVFYSQFQDTQQTSEPSRGVKDVLLPTTSVMQNRVSFPVSNLNLHQSQNQVQPNSQTGF
jgi:hypothetical protein